MARLGGVDSRFRWQPLEDVESPAKLDEFQMKDCVLATPTLVQPKEYSSVSSLEQKVQSC